jgi:hypothetical protein
LYQHTLKNGHTQCTVHNLCAILIMEMIENFLDNILWFGNSYFTIFIGLAQQTIQKIIMMICETRLFNFAVIHCSETKNLNSSHEAELQNKWFAQEKMKILSTVHQFFLYVKQAFVDMNSLLQHHEQSKIGEVNLKLSFPFVVW